MSQTSVPLKAAQIEELLFSYDKDVDKMNKLAIVAPADLEATYALSAGLDARRWRVVLGCTRALGKATGPSAAAAVPGLVTRLNHPYAEVRTEAAKSLAVLSQLVEVPIEPLGEAFLGEEEMDPFLALGRTLVSVLRSGCPAPASWASRFHEALSAIRDLRLLDLPLGGAVPERHQTPIANQAAPPGLMSRLLGRQKTKYQHAHADPPPRPGRPETRRFLNVQGDRHSDVPEVLSLTVRIFTYVPTNSKARLSLILDICQMPLATFETSEALVVMAASSVRDEQDKTAFLASMWGWDRSYDPTWTGRLALSAAEARPDLRLPLFEFLWARQSRIDWKGWANSVGQATPFELKSVVDAALTAPEEDLQGWMTLLSLAPVEHILPALGRALGSTERPVAHDALERLLLSGLPVPWMLNEILRLRGYWSEDLDMLRGLDTLMREATSPDTPLPEGMREPDRIIEWTLEDSTANPFLQNNIEDWRDGLQHLNAFCTQDGNIHLITATVMVSIKSDSDVPRVLMLPDETAGSGMSLLAVGHQGDLLFAERGRNPVFLYLLKSGSETFQRLESSLPLSDLPVPGEVLTDGATYGWAKIVESEGQTEGSLGLRKDISYLVDLKTGRVENAWTEGMLPLENLCLETKDSALPSLAFLFAACGGYRISESQPLAIPTGNETPIFSQGRVDGRIALHIEVFPTRLCRIYFWRLSF